MGVSKVRTVLYHSDSVNALEVAKTNVSKSELVGENKNQVDLPLIDMLTNKFSQLVVERWVGHECSYYICN